MRKPQQCPRPKEKLLLPSSPACDSTPIPKNPPRLQKASSSVVSCKKEFPQTTPLPSTTTNNQPQRRYWFVWNQKTPENQSNPKPSPIPFRIVRCIPTPGLYRKNNSLIKARCKCRLQERLKECILTINIKKANARPIGRLVMASLATHVRLIDVILVSLEK